MCCGGVERERESRLCVWCVRECVCVCGVREREVVCVWCVCGVCVLCV